MALIYKTQQLTEVYANSGYWADIQNAVDQAKTGDNVYIPEGTFDFVNVGEAWAGYRVVIPAGVNLFGAPTERTSGLSVPERGMNPNNQVIVWKTVLRLPWDVPGSWFGNDQPPPTGGGPPTPFWFAFIGAGDASKPSRFSDIKLVGYRSIDPSSRMILKGIYIENVMGLRVDHWYFEHVAGGGVTTWGNACRGVIDHCFFINPVAQMVGDMEYETVGYGAQIYGRGYGIQYWENDISRVLGKYTDYTVFIEDCYFHNWRHCTASGNGAHYVLRYSTIEDDFGFGSIDAHGRTNIEGTVITQIGTRAVEIYGCKVIDAGKTLHDPQSWYWATMIRGGSGVAFNNTVGGGTYTDFIYFTNEAQPEVSQCWCHDWWVWNNTMLGGCTEIVKYDPDNQIIEGRDYFLHAPHTFSYEPYPYPHPLITGEEPPPPPAENITPWTQELDEGIYRITMPPQVQVGSEIYNFKQWEDGSTNLERTINLTADIAITATYELLPPPPPGKGYLDIHAFLNSQEIVIPLEITELAITSNTPKIVEVDPGIYTIKATLGTETKTETAQVLGGQTVRVDFHFEVLPTLPLAIVPVVSATAGLILTGIAIS